MGTIKLITKFFPLAFLLYFFPARAGLDGAEPEKVGWGTKDYSVPPGEHRLHIHFPYFFGSKFGKADVTVTVQEDQTVTVTYKTPWLVFLPGRVKVS
jgi:hypothetical protein